MGGRGVGTQLSTGLSISTGPMITRWRIHQFQRFVVRATDYHLVKRTKRQLQLSWIFNLMLHDNRIVWRSQSRGQRGLICGLFVMKIKDVWLFDTLRPAVVPLGLWWYTSGSRVYPIVLLHFGGPPKASKANMANRSLLALTSKEHDQTSTVLHSKRYMYSIFAYACKYMFVYLCMCKQHVGLYIYLLAFTADRHPEGIWAYCSWVYCRYVLLPISKQLPRPVLVRENCRVLSCRKTVLGFKAILLLGLMLWMHAVCCSCCESGSPTSSSDACHGAGNFRGRWSVLH